MGDTFGELAIYLGYLQHVCEEHDVGCRNSEPFKPWLIHGADIVGDEPGWILEFSMDNLFRLFLHSPRLLCNVVRVGEEQLQAERAGGRAEAGAALESISGVHPLLSAGFCCGVPTEQVHRALESISPQSRSYKSEDMVVHQGDDGDSVFVVRSGLFSCRVNGTEVRQFGPLEMFGEVSLCASFPDLVLGCIRIDELQSGDAGHGTPGRLGMAVAACSVRTADVVCLEAGDVTEVTAQDLSRVFDSSPQMFANVYRRAELRFAEAVAYGSLDAIIRYQS